MGTPFLEDWVALIGSLFCSVAIRASWRMFFFWSTTMKLKWGNLRQTYPCSALNGFLWMPTCRQADRTSEHDDIHQRAPVYNDKITETVRWVDGAMGVHCIWGSKLWQIYLWGSGQWRGQRVPECANNVINKFFGAIAAMVTYCRGIIVYFQWWMKYSVPVFK